MFLRRRLPSSTLIAIIAASGLAAGLAGACSPTDNGGSSTTGAGASDSQSSSSVGQGGGTSGQGGAGGAGGSASGAGGAGGSVPVGCQSDADCLMDPVGKVCDTSSGDCVGCLPQADKCIQGQYCSPATFQCEVGCTDDSDCDPANNLLCNTSTHNCVGCVQDSNCPLGSICLADTCVAGCSDAHPCQPGFSCCNSTCYDLSSDEEHCGTCANACEKLPHAEPFCSNGVCEIGPCEGVYADCDFVPDNGCEQNTLQEGTCVCAPGDKQSCYYGSDGTENVGPCKAGTQTCNADGLAWGDCVGQVLPSSEVCNDGIDQDCDGVVDNPTDIDGDGWAVCNGDCCDNLGECSNPKLVNPGAYEIVGDGVDNDCNPATSDVIPALCSSTADFDAVTALDVAKAMDLCQQTAPNPPLAQKTWGVISASQLLANGNAPSGSTLTHMQNWQTAILADYGTGGVTPKRGLTMAGISTGKMRDQSDAGYVFPSPGTDFNTTGNPPAAYLAAHNNNLPSSAGCSGNCPAGTGANDSVNIKLTIRVPTNALSFSYNFRFFTVEYSNFACSVYNDFYLALLQTGAPGIPADKNISFDAQGNPVSVNNGFFDVCKPKGCYMCPSGNGPLAGTGMDVNDVGGATNWLTTDAPVVPGETMVLEMMVFDVTDKTLDSVVLLDNFTWNAIPLTVGTHE